MSLRTAGDNAAHSVFFYVQTLRKCLWSASEVIFLGNSTIDRGWGSACNPQILLVTSGVVLQANKDGSSPDQVFCPEETGSELADRTAASRKVTDLMTLAIWWSDKRFFFLRRVMFARISLEEITIRCIFYRISKRNLGAKRDFYWARLNDDYAFCLSSLEHYRQETIVWHN